MRKICRKLTASALLLAGCAASIASLPMTAEETFKKIEERVLNAKTVSVKFKWELRREGKEEQRADGILLVKEGNKFFLYETFLIDGRKTEKQQVSDGSKMAVWENAERRGKATPKKEAGRLLNGFLRAGVVQGQWIGIEVPLGLKVPRQEPDQMNLTDLTYGEEEKDAKSIIYKFKDQNGKKGKVWYDPRTLKLLKRTISFGGADDTGIIESYDEFTLNAEIPDEKFRLSSDK